MIETIHLSFPTNLMSIDIPTIIVDTPGIDEKQNTSSIVKFLETHIT
jgi:hypothetical protein